MKKLLSIIALVTLWNQGLLAASSNNVLSMSDLEPSARNSSTERIYEEHFLVPGESIIIDGNKVVCGGGGGPGLLEEGTYQQVSGTPGLCREHRITNCVFDQGVLSGFTVYFRGGCSGVGNFRCNGNRCKDPRFSDVIRILGSNVYRMSTPNGSQVVSGTYRLKY